MLKCKDFKQSFLYVLKFVNKKTFLEKTIFIFKIFLTTVKKNLSMRLIKLFYFLWFNLNHLEKKLTLSLRKYSTFIVNKLRQNSVHFLSKKLICKTYKISRLFCRLISTTWRKILQCLPWNILDFYSKRNKDRIVHIYWKIKAGRVLNSKSMVSLGQLLLQRKEISQ